MAQNPQYVPGKRRRRAPRQTTDPVTGMGGAPTGGEGGATFNPLALIYGEIAGLAHACEKFGDTPTQVKNRIGKLLNW